MDPRYLEFISNHYFLSLGLVVVSYLLIQDLAESILNKFTSLSPLLAVTKMNTDDVVVIDVREPTEFVKGHIEDAINIPLGSLTEQLSSLEKYKQQDLLVVCQTGTRSTPACKQLIKANFEKVFALTGGMQSWEDNKLPMKLGKK